MCLLLSLGHHPVQFVPSVDIRREALYAPQKVTICQSPQLFEFKASSSFEPQRAFCRFSGGGGSGDSGSSIVQLRITSKAKYFIALHVTALYGSGNGRLDKWLDFRACAIS